MMETLTENSFVDSEIEYAKQAFVDGKIEAEEMEARIDGWLKWQSLSVAERRELEAKRVAMRPIDLNANTDYVRGRLLRDPRKPSRR